MNILNKQLSILEYVIFLFIMMQLSNDYKLLAKFLDAYLPVGFEGIREDDPLVKQINTMLLKNKQFFYIGDMLKFDIVYTGATIKEVMGIEASEFNPGSQYVSTHPDDMQRHGVSRSKMVKISSDILNSKNDYLIMSTNLRFRHIKGHYINTLVQAYTFYSHIPEPSVYSLFVLTDIDWFGPIKHGYNFIVGKDLSCFRIPDKELIQTGCIFTDREYEILNLIRKGYDSQQIGEKLFLSTHTVDTHRRNIIKKTNYQSTSELIIAMQEKGFF